MYTSIWPIFYVCVDMAIFRRHPQNGIEVLLIRRKVEPYKGQLCLPGGHLGIDELAEDGAKRELLEETGIQTPLVFAGILDKVDRNPDARKISALYTNLQDYQGDVVAGDDAEDAQWVYYLNLPDLAFDHNLAVNKAIHVWMEHNC